MNDPVQDVLNALRNDRQVQVARFTRNFLSNVADVFEREGFATTELFLRDKRTQRELEAQAEVLLNRVLPVLRACPRICEERAIGRYVIKSLQSLRERPREEMR